VVVVVVVVQAEGAEVAAAVVKDLDVRSSAGGERRPIARFPV
jgi:hypothetical protein